MEGSRHDNNLHLCFHGDDAPCACACPFDFDLRSFMEKMQLGRIDAAFRLYRNAVVFPDIVWRVCPAPCGDSCVRSGSDAALSFTLLEHACLEYARSTDPIAFNLPQKTQRIAIVGAGLSGLTCAMKFVPKKYDVTIYEKTGVIGGGLSRYVPEEIYLTEFQKQFGDEKYTLLLNTPVVDLNALDYDAIYVSSGADAVGEGDRVFRCPPDIEPIDMIAHGIGSLHEIEWFLKTGKRKEAEQTGLKEDRAAAMGAKTLTPAPAMEPENGSAFTKEEAVAEAKRCIRCDCSACLDNCELLRKYQMYPARLMEEVNLTMNPVTLFTGRVALREICSCSQCGLCKQLCPVDVDVGDYFLRTRRELEETDAFPKAFHDFWLRDMAFSNGEAGLLLKLSPRGLREGGVIAPGEPEGTAAQRVFFPGCQLGASDPRYVTLAYEYLLRRLPDTALFLRCCGAPALWAGDDRLHRAELDAIRGAWEELGRPEFLLACPSCRKMFREYLPEISCRMIYKIFLEFGAPELGVATTAAATAAAASTTAVASTAAAKTVPTEAASATSASATTAAVASTVTAAATATPAAPTLLTASVFDPCAGRNDPALQQSVRTLAENAGFALEELPHSREEARCCSWGGQSFTADPALAETIVANNANQSKNPYIAYCVNCRDILAASGKPVWHILDVLFGINDSHRPSPTATARRENKAELRRGLMETYDGQGSILRYGDENMSDAAGLYNTTQPEGAAVADEGGQARAATQIELIISDELARKMSDALILEEDVRAVVAHCEQTGLKLLDPGTGRFIGHLRRGIITYWAVYTLETEGCYTLTDAYCHRMMIEEE